MEMLEELADQIRNSGGALVTLPQLARQRLIATTLAFDRRAVVGVLASRLGRRPETNRGFVQRLQRLAQLMRGRRQIGCYAANSPAAPFIRRALARRGVPTIAVDAAARSWRSWRRRVDNAVKCCRSAAVVSPPEACAAPVAAALEAIPLADRVVAGLSDAIAVVHMRKGGAIERLLQTSPSARFDLNDIDESPAAGETRFDLPRPSRIATPNARPAAPYLVHCTRAPQGPWPGETQSQFVDAVLAGADARDALASLKRIIDARRIRASNQCIRGGAAVVCFADIQLEALPELRTYQRHRGRWDFEPYGLCIAKAALRRRGARRVVYGDETQWRALPIAEQPYFQIAASNRQLDWRREREWRLAGDLELASLIAEGQVWAFVSSADEAARLRARAPLPVMCLTERGRTSG